MTLAPVKVTVQKLKPIPNMNRHELLVEIKNANREKIKVAVQKLKLSPKVLEWSEDDLRTVLKEIGHPAFVETVAEVDFDEFDVAPTVETTGKVCLVEHTPEGFIKNVWVVPSRKEAEAQTAKSNNPKTTFQLAEDLDDVYTWPREVCRNLLERRLALLGERMPEEYKSREQHYGYVLDTVIELANYSGNLHEGKEEAIKATDTKPVTKPQAQETEAEPVKRTRATKRVSYPATAPVKMPRPGTKQEVMYRLLLKGATPEEITDALNAEGGAEVKNLKTWYGTFAKSTGFGCEEREDGKIYLTYPEEQLEMNLTGEEPDIPVGDSDIVEAEAKTKTEVATIKAVTAISEGVVSINGGDDWIDEVIEASPEAALKMPALTRVMQCLSGTQAAVNYLGKVLKELDQAVQALNHNVNK